MSWWPIIVLAGGAYAFKAVGLLAFDAKAPRGRLVEALALLPPALLASLIVVQTVAVDASISIDARSAGVGVAALVAIAWRRAPFIVVLVAAAAVTALVRAAT